MGKLGHYFGIEWVSMVNDKLDGKREGYTMIVGIVLVCEWTSTHIRGTLTYHEIYIICYSTVLLLYVHQM